MSTFTNEITNKKILRLQKSLPLLRNLAGWTAEDLGNNIGVTRQTITNIEKSQTLAMTKTQYIAIRAVFDYEIESSKNEALDKAIEAFVEPEKLPEDKKKLTEKYLEELAALKPRRVNDKKLLASVVAATTALAATGLVLPALVEAPAVVPATLLAPKWLSDLMKK